MKNSFSASIGVKLLALVLAVSLIAIAVTTILAINFIDSVLKDDIKNKLLAQSEERGHSIELLFDNRINQINQLANSPIFLKLISELNSIDDKQILESKLEETRIRLTVEISNFQITEGQNLALEDVQIIGKNDQIFFSLNNPQKIGTIYEEQKFSNEVIQPKVDIIAGNEAGQTKMLVTVPIFDYSERSQKYIGTILATTDTKSLDLILSNRQGLESTGEVYLVNTEGVMISKSLFIQNAPFNQKIDSIAVTECLEHGKTVSDVYRDYRGVKIFGTSYCNLNDGFILLTEMDEKEVLKSLVALEEKIIGAGAVLMVGTSVLTYFLSKRLSNPIIKLRNAAKEVSEGNFDVKTNIKTRDEIGQLSSTFDTMAKNLQESQIAINLREEIIKQQEDILLSFSEQNENCCVCLVDIIQSTMLTANLSDGHTKDFYEIFINSIAEIVKKFDGIVVKNIGDAVLFYFPKIKSTDKESFKNVLECCLAIGESNHKINKKMGIEGLPGIAYRTSVTYGSVSIAKVSTSSVADIFGATVNRCSKINRFALPNSVIIGSDVYTHVKSLSGYDFKNMNVNPAGTLPIFSVFLVTRK